MSSGPERASSASPIVVGSPRSTISAPRGWWRSTVGPSAAACSTFRRSRHSSSAGSRAHPCRARPAGRLPSRSPSVPGGPRHGRREARSRRFDSSSSSPRRRRTGHERSPGQDVARAAPRPSTRATACRSDRSGSCRPRCACGAHRPTTTTRRGSGTGASRPPIGGADGVSIGSQRPLSNIDARAPITSARRRTSWLSGV